MPPEDPLDELIEQITMDAYSDEGPRCFLQAFEDAIQFPLPATLAGIAVVIASLDFDGNGQRDIVAVTRCLLRWRLALIWKVRAMASCRPHLVPLPSDRCWAVVRGFCDLALVRTSVR